MLHTQAAADVSRRTLSKANRAPTDVGGYGVLANRAKCEICRLGHTRWHTHSINHMKPIILLVSTSLTLNALAVELGTRQQTIIPRDIPPDAPHIGASNVDQYVSAGYGLYDLGLGTNQGVRLDLMPSGYASANHAARLLSFFSITDIHITDKESPIQVPYVGWQAAYHDGGPGGLYSSAYSPVMFSSPQMLDAAIRTVNSLHKVTPFDFGISLGDVGNAGQHNEVRWFIDVMDGKWIRPSSGAHLGGGYR